MKFAQGTPIGRVAAETGVNIETIRYYEKIGLTPGPDRTQGGHRSYGPDHIDRLAFVRRARALGFGLDDIRALMALSEQDRRTCAEVEVIAATHLVAVRGKIADLVRLEAVLREAVGRCATGDAPLCPVIQVLNTRKSL
jgi:MerR family mercuric resistance operon transcriptional regulator